jgi:hypothetical protein
VAIERNEINFMLQSLQTDISDGKAIQNSFKCIYFCYFLKLIGTRYSSKRTKEKKKKKKKKEGKEEEEITPVYREVLWAVFDGAAVSSTRKHITARQPKIFSFPINSSTN